jgi:hypothetical protein
MTITDPWATPETQLGVAEVSKQYATGAGVIPLEQAKAYLGYKPAVAAPEGRHVMTFKEGQGFESTWHVVHAATVADAKAVLMDPEFRELLDLQKKAAGVFRSGSTSSPQGGNTGGRQSAPQGATEAPVWAPPKPYYDAVYKSGVSKKNGKVWHAWMPPEQGDDREPLFFNAPK